MRYFQNMFAKAMFFLWNHFNPLKKYIHMYIYDLFYYSNFSNQSLLSCNCDFNKKKVTLEWIWFFAQCSHLLTTLQHNSQWLTLVSERHCKTAKWHNGQVKKELDKLKRKVPLTGKLEQAEKEKQTAELNKSACSSHNHNVHNLRSGVPITSPYLPPTEWICHQF